MAWQNTRFKICYRYGYWAIWIVDRDPVVIPYLVGYTLTLPEAFERVEKLRKRCAKING